MYDLFANFWWVLFPLSGFAFAGWGMFLRYKRQKAVLDLIRSYVENGREPPESLLAQIETLDEGQSGWMSGGQGRGRAPTNYWSLVGLFTMMAGGFGIAALMGVDGGSGAFVIVAMTMGAVAVWALICALTQKRDGVS
ncbi:hypothetical protein [Brevundimonas variabilis]|uniref:Uncharacterized protein n=1 Tax=Brevundimonas variabilis TaxID=74312 RepID=A0A7W9CHY1_9CAUL|nr:hypothetical protein [Brevundimonas variabilis]MBB5745989.1 hypothetical protein [Brevundimonas variabilis]